MRCFFPVFFFCCCTSIISGQGVYQLWGSTPFGGASGIGSIYSLDSAGNNFKNRYSFPAINPGGEMNGSKLLFLNGKYYGFHASASGYYDLFEWDPITNIYVKKIDLGSYSGTTSKVCELSSFGGKIYGLISRPKKYGSGGIFEWDPVSNIFSFKHYFKQATGYSTDGGLTLLGGKFYGMTTTGGINNSGVIFEWDPATSIYVKKIDLGGTIEGFPKGRLVLFDNKFYGIAQGNMGYIIFQWDPVTNNFVKKVNLQDAGISDRVEQDLVEVNGIFYGVTTVDLSANNGGSIFEWNPATNICTKRKELFPIGLDCKGRLTWFNNKFYGTTERGGSEDLGVLFTWDPFSNILEKKIDFSNTNGVGIRPSNSLTLDQNGKMYGATRGGYITGNALAEKSTFFEYNPTTNTVILKININEDIKNGKWPLGQLAHFKGKLHGVTGFGGTNEGGVLFSWHSDTGFIKHKDFSSEDAIGSPPIGGLSEWNNKLFGITFSSAVQPDNPGGIFQWDPLSNVIIPKAAGGHGRSIRREGLTLINGKFYGLNSEPGYSIFEWDPQTSLVTNKVGFSADADREEAVTMNAYNGKIYGVIYTSITHPLGGIFEWDPGTNAYFFRHEMSIENGSFPYGDLTEFNGKLYGLASQGGVNDEGVIFEWDPATNTYSKRFDMSVATGSRPQSGLTLNGLKFIGTTTEGGSFNKGVVFEWDPITNIYLIKHHFNGLDGAQPINNDLIRMPALVSRGIPGTCTSPLSVVIDNSNNTKWVGLTDENGDVVAEIRANGNNLGLVNYQLYVHNGAVREDASGKLYLNRNLTITPAIQPSTPVEIRFYITEKEFQTLRTATNSFGQSSGINTINDVGFFKNGSSCSGGIQAAAVVLPAVASGYEDGYVLTASISSFSSFYFANKAFTVLPLRMIGFNIKERDEDAILEWTTDLEVGIKGFVIERSIDGQVFHTLSDQAATGGLGRSTYQFIDIKALNIAAERLYYRLKILNDNDHYSYSDVIIISLRKKQIDLLLYPNPTRNNPTLFIHVEKRQSIQLTLVDNVGRLVYRQKIQAEAGNSTIIMPINNLQTGFYWLKVKGAALDRKLAFVKE